jgi:hypothetical protein
MMARQLLLNSLRRVMPAVSRYRMIPELQHVCFTGDHLVAFDDQIAISVPRTSTFTDCIPGKPLTDLLAGSRAAIVHLAANGNNTVAVMLGRTSAELPMLPVTAFTQRFTMPPMPKQNVIKGRVAGRFFAGIAHCLKSIPRWGTTASDLHGITVIPNGDHLSLYSSDVVTISRADVTDAPAIAKRVILNEAFCKQMLRLAKRAHTMRLAVMDDHAMFAVDHILLYGRLLEPDPKRPPYDFPGIVAKYAPKGSTTQAVAVPRQLGAILQRAVKVVARDPTEITIVDGLATFVTQSVKKDAGAVSETLELPQHPDVSLRVDADLLLRAHATFPSARILFTDRSIILSKNERIRLVSAAAAAEAKAERYRRKKKE